MIYTIGYAGIKIEQFLEILKKDAITYLIDVRSTPRSQYFPSYNDNSLKKALAERGIKYANLKDEFGAKQEDIGFITNGVVDFEKFARSEQFEKGISKVVGLVKDGEVVCIMCAEIDPIGCHRAMLCARHLDGVKHIIARKDKVIAENHAFLEERLKKMHGMQQSLFVEDLEVAYRKQNQKIGYRPKGKMNEKENLHNDKIPEG